MQQPVESNRYTGYVEEQVRWAQQIGVTGVPTYVINDRYAVVGAQPDEVFKNALTQSMNQKG
jgi:predicted DsbA family dithiol-disulfide isomerase